MIELLAPLATVAGGTMVMMAATLSALTKYTLAALFPRRLAFSRKTLIRVALAEIVIMAGVLVVTFSQIANHATPQNPWHGTTVVIFIAFVTILHGAFALLPNRVLIRGSNVDGESTEQSHGFLCSFLLGLLTPLYLTGFVIMLCILW